MNLTGTTAVTSSTTFRYIESASTDIRCTGTVTIRRATGDTFIVSIPGGALETTVVQRFTGEKTSYLTGWRVDVTQITGTVSFQLRFYPDDNYSISDSAGLATSFVLIDQAFYYDALSGIPYPKDLPFNQPIKLSPGGWLAVFAQGANANADVSALIQGYDTN